MHLLAYLAALLGALALLVWFGWDLRQPRRVGVRDGSAAGDRDANASPSPTPHWRNPGVVDGRR